MRVRLTASIAERIDGVDLARREVGDTFDLAPRDARLLRRVELHRSEYRRRRATSFVRCAAFRTRRSNTAAGHSSGPSPSSRVS
jgi:hypothetical protein